MAWKARMPRRRSALELLLLTALFCLFVLFAYPSIIGRGRRPLGSRPLGQPEQSSPCSLLPGVKDTVVILRTSAAELQDKLPVHFDTTFSCYQNYIIFSDFAEVYKGHRIYDALSSVDAHIRQHDPDFELWRRLQQGGPDVLEDEEIWNADKTTKDLDKWKWLPMLDRTMIEFPKAKWYIFVETGTFIFWKNMQTLLGNLDHKKPYYIGDTGRRAGMMNEAYGDAGIILSRAALKAVVDVVRKDKTVWEENTRGHETGESTLAEALLTAQVAVTDAWPLLEHQRPATLDYGTRSWGRRLWCSPVVSYGGISQLDIAEFWKFEQESANDKLLHKNVFEDFIMPRLAIRSGRVDDWDNFSEDLEPVEAESVDHCQGHCTSNKKCVQYSYSDGICRFSSVPKMGEFKRGVESRWLLSRSMDFAERMGSCEGVES